MKKFFKKYWKAFFIIFWYVFFSIALIYFCSLTVKASSEQTYFPMHQNKNGHFTESQISLIENYFNSEDNYIFVRYQGTYTNYTGCFVLYYPKTNTNGVYGEIFTNGYQFSLYYNGSVTGATVTNARLNNNGTVNLFSTTFAYAFQNLNSSEYDSNCDYVSNFKLYTNNNPDTRNVVLNYGYIEPDYNYTGHAVPPDLDSPEYPTGATIPDRVPQFHTWNSYTWNTYNPPTFDTSTLESMVESLGDIIKYNAEYIADGIGGSIENLGANLKNYIEDLGNIMKYYGDLISGNIKKFAENIYDNLKELLEPIQTVVDLFVKPWDSQEFQQQLNESSFYGSLNTTITQIRSFGTSLTNAAEPDNLTLTINLTGIGWGISEIDFNWLKPFRNIIRLIIGCVLVYWLVIEIITGLNNVIGSGGDNEE